jgi:alpha-beta hydrolase superfamily lysophospholipase
MANPYTAVDRLPRVELTPANRLNNPKELAIIGQVHYRYATVRNQRLFYREAGRPDMPAVVLLHGFPSSSFMFRELIPRLADRYHVIAPDHLGFGYSDAPSVADSTTRSTL